MEKLGEKWGYTLVRWDIVTLPKDKGGLSIDYKIKLSNDHLT